MKPTKLPETIGGLVVSVCVGAGLAVGLSILYLTIYGMGHLMNPVPERKKR